MMLREQRAGALTRIVRVVEDLRQPPRVAGIPKACATRLAGTASSNTPATTSPAPPYLYRGGGVASLHESIAQRVVLAQTTRTCGAVAPQARGLRARQRRVSPNSHRGAPNTVAPRELITPRLSLSDLRCGVLAALQAAAA